MFTFLIKTALVIFCIRA